MHLKSKLNQFLCFSHFDCAPVYLNEKAIGKVFKEWIDAGKVKREELFVTTKLPDYGELTAELIKTITTTLTKTFDICLELFQ